jgi:hypothetical protein
MQFRIYPLTTADFEDQDWTGLKAQLMDCMYRHVRTNLHIDCSSDEMA